MCSGLNSKLIAHYKRNLNQVRVLFNRGRKIFLREPQSFLRGDKNTEDGDKTGSQNGGHTAGIDLKFF